MKKILIILALTGFISCGSEMHEQKDFGLIAKAELKGCFNLPQNLDPLVNTVDSLLFFLVDVKLINPTDHPIGFITYTCTSSGNIVVDSRAVMVCANRCSGNGPMPIELKPNQEISLPVIIQTNKVNSNMKIKLGWVYIDKDSKLIRSFSDISKLLNKKRERLEDVIWSEPIYLESSSGKPLEIR
jgi:hypothetical protein